MTNLNIILLMILAAGALLIMSIIAMSRSVRRCAKDKFLLFKHNLDLIRNREIDTIEDLHILKIDTHQAIISQGVDAYDFCLKEEWDSKLKYLIINFLFGIVLMFVILIANNLYLKLILSIVAIAIYLILLYIVRKRERSASIYVNKEIDCFLNDEFNIFSYTTGTNRYL